MWLVHSYAVLCLVLALLFGTAAILLDVDLFEKVRLLSTVLLLVAIMCFVYWSSSDVFTANRLSKIRRGGTVADFHGSPATACSNTGLGK